MGLKFEEFCKCVRFCLHKALPERTPVANVRNKRAQFRSFYSENLHINAFLEFVVFSLCSLVLNCYLNPQKSTSCEIDWLWTNWSQITLFLHGYCTTITLLIYFEAMKLLAPCLLNAPPIVQCEHGVLHFPLPCQWNRKEQCCYHWTRKLHCYQ